MHFKTFSGPLLRVKFCPFDIITQAASLTSSTTQKQVQPWVPLSVSPSSPSIYPQLFHPSAWLWLSDHWHLLRSPLTSGTGFHLVQLSATEARKQKWENEKHTVALRNKETKAEILADRGPASKGREPKFLWRYSSKDLAKIILHLCTNTK